MNRLLTATAACSLLLSGAAAEAAKKPSPRAKVYTATLAPLAGSAEEVRQEAPRVARG